MNFSSLFSFNDTSSTEIYTLSLHDALPIFRSYPKVALSQESTKQASGPPHRSSHPSSPPCYSTSTPSLPNRSHPVQRPNLVDRKSTRLNSSHVEISYAVFCLKKKKNHKTNT